MHCVCRGMVELLFDVQQSWLPTGFLASICSMTMWSQSRARGSQVVKFVGCYHGHADSFLVQAGSGVATLGLPDSPGVPASSTGTGHD